MYVCTTFPVKFMSIHGGAHREYGVRWVALLGHVLVRCARFHLVQQHDRIHEVRIDGQLLGGTFGDRCASSDGCTYVLHLMLVQDAGRVPAGEQFIHSERCDRQPADVLVIRTGWARFTVRLPDGRHAHVTVTVTLHTRARLTDCQHRGRGGGGASAGVGGQFVTHITEFGENQVLQSYLGRGWLGCSFILTYITYMITHTYMYVHVRMYIP